MKAVRWIVLAGIVLSTLLPLAGCEGPPDNGTPPIPVTEKTFEEQIEKIKNDPNMTPDNKQRAIQGIEMAKRMRESGGGQAAGMDAAAKARASAGK